MLKIGAQLCSKTLTCFVKSPLLHVMKSKNLVFPNAESVRNTSFFNQCTKEQLWKGVLSVSNAGRRKGRARRRNIAKKSSMTDSTLGNGSLRVLWPGLNTNVLSKNKPVEIKSLPPVEKPKFVVPETSLKRSRNLHPLDRGWSGKKITGRKMGPPKPFQDRTFEDFESIVLEHKSKSLMTSIFGRRKKFFSIVATGNGNGLIGLATVKKFDGNIGLKLAQKKASKKLLTIDLIEKHTVNHDFFSQYGSTRVFVFKRPKGFGLRCHRVITALCKLIGIEDLHAKVEGSCNVRNIIRAFIVGLLKQKTYQEIADEKKLHLVEFKEESYNFPLVLASPEKCLSPIEARKNPVIFEEYIMGNKLLYKADKKVPFFQRLPSWNTHLLKTLFCRNHKKVKIDLLVKYGEYKSHLTAVYPECICSSQKKKQTEDTAESFN